MPDFDVSAVSLHSPPAEAPQQAYRPAILAKNNGRYSAAISGTLAIIDLTTGRQVFFDTLWIGAVAPGQSSPVPASKDWTPANEGPHLAYGSVTTEHDAIPGNNALPPVSFIVGPPPPPPEPATLDDVVERLDLLGTEQTLTGIKAALPAAPATEPTLEEVRDKLPADPATETTLALLPEKLDSIAQEDTLVDTKSVLGAGLPPALGPTGGLKVEPIGSTPPTELANHMHTLGKVQIGTQALELPFGSVATRGIIIRAHPDNTGMIFVGSSLVNPAGENSITYLEAGDCLTLEYNDVNPVYLCASIPAQFAFVGALNIV